MPNRTASLWPIRLDRGPFDAFMAASSSELPVPQPPARRLPPKRSVFLSGTNRTRLISMAVPAQSASCAALCRSTHTRSALSAPTLPRTETIQLVENTSTTSQARSTSSPSCGFFVPESSTTNNEQTERSLLQQQYLSHFPSTSNSYFVPVTTATDTDYSPNIPYNSTSFYHPLSPTTNDHNAIYDQEVQKDEEEEKTTYYLIPAAAKKARVCNVKTSPLLTPATSPPYSDWNNLSPDSGLGCSSKSSPYFSLNDLNLHSPCSFTSTPSPNFCEPFNTNWESWLDEIVEEVQQEIRAELMFYTASSESKEQPSKSYRKRKASTGTSDSNNTVSESDGERETDSDSGASTTLRAKKYSLAALSHEEIAQRKKEQNRIAAQRYRSRKTQTLEEGRHEIAHFEKKNAELRKEEAELAQEIQRLKQTLVSLKSGGD
jgi:hypothetical protein